MLGVALVASLGCAEFREARAVRRRGARGSCQTGNRRGRLQYRRARPRRSMTPSTAGRQQVASGSTGTFVVHHRADDADDVLPRVGRVSRHPDRSGLVFSVRISSGADPRRRVHLPGDRSSVRSRSALTCDKVASQLVALTALATAACSQVSNGVCRPISNPAGTGGAAGCDQNCLATCAGVPGCPATCGCASSP